MISSGMWLMWRMGIKSFWYSEELFPSASKTGNKISPIKKLTIPTVRTIARFIRASTSLSWASRSKCSLNTGTSEVSTPILHSMSADTLLEDHLPYWLLPNSFLLVSMILFSIPLEAQEWEISYLMTGSERLTQGITTELPKEEILFPTFLLVTLASSTMDKKYSIPISTKDMFNVLPLEKTRNAVTSIGSLSIFWNTWIIWDSITYSLCFGHHACDIHRIYSFISKIKIS